MGEDDALRVFDENFHARSVPSQQLHRTIHRGRLVRKRVRFLGIRSAQDHLVHGATLLLRRHSLIVRRAEPVAPMQRKRVTTMRAVF